MSGMRKDILHRRADIEGWIEGQESKAFMCRELNCKPETLEAYLDRMGLEYRGNKGRTGRTKPWLRQPLEQYLVEGSLIHTHELKRRLLRDNIKQHRCEKCRTTTWQGQPVP